MTNRLWTALATACILSCDASHVTAQSPADVTTLKRFAGIWRLVSNIERHADGRTKQIPFRLAYIVYTENSRMCYVSMIPNRPNWGADTPTPDEALSVVDNTNFYAYCAAVEVHAEEGFVIHHVEIDKVPNLVGTAKKRWFTFDVGGRLSLRIDPAENEAPVVEDVLLWERVSKSGDPRSR